MSLICPEPTLHAGWKTVLPLSPLWSYSISQNRRIYLKYFSEKEILIISYKLERGRGRLR